MFYFLCKTILHSRHGLQNHKSILISIKHISTTSKPNQSFTVSYLIDSCGFSQETALSVSKRIHFDSPEKPDSVIAFFNNHGFTKPQISTFIRIFPQLLTTTSPEKTLLPKLEFFKSKGFSNPELVNTSFNYLTNLLRSDERTTSVIERYPRILFDDVGKYIMPNVNILRVHGVPEKNIAMFLYRWPRFLIVTSFKNVVEVVKGMGFHPWSKYFVVAIVAKLEMRKSLWERKLDAYKRWGWSEEECLGAFVKYPWCMMFSEDKITTAMDIFVNKIGWESSLISGCPQLVCLSMEKRVIPRAAVLQFLLSKGLVNRKNNTNFTVSALFECPEKAFRKRFVDCYKGRY